MAFDFNIENDIAVITFDDGKVNAVGFDLIEKFNTALDEAENNANAVVSPSLGSIDNKDVVLLNAWIHRITRDSK